MRRCFSLAALTLVMAGCSREPASTGSRRMIVLGVDGMDPQFLEAHWDSLPHLNRLRKEGGFRSLATTIPPQSPVAWSTVISGMDPGGHGIFDFIHRDPVTRMPVSSMAEAYEPRHKLALGPYVIPLSAGGVRRLRAGPAFWQLLADRGIHTTVIRIPVNFPPVECEAESLSGMGTPDMQGTFGTFTFFTDDPDEKREQVPGGRIVRVPVENGRAVLSIAGPVNSLRRDRAVSTVSLIAYLDPAEPVARFDMDGTQMILRQGEWSHWLQAEFPVIPGLQSAAGMFRVYLQQVHPRLRIYITPVNIDPRSPELPISTPPEYSRVLADSLGPFYTQGIAEETSAVRAGILSRAEFLVQSRKVLSDSLRLFRYELDRFSSGLLFYYFSSVDQTSHLLWGKYEGELLEIYQAIDQAIGQALVKAGSDPLMVISDHGFAPFDRAVHLNSWLLREGFLTLDSASNTGDQELFAHVDWNRTQAYALGLNAIYLNLEGRETGGIVAASERRKVLDLVAKRLLEFQDPKTGEQVVSTVYFPSEVFLGRNLRQAPDLLVGYRRGYRASWKTALGAVPQALLEDNTQPWIGDHCMAADQVPGVLLSNQPLRAPQPQLADITATILDQFAVPKADGMIGRPVF